MKGSDVPGTLFSNTSSTNLNKKSDWPARLGFTLAQQYQAQVSFRDLVLAGRDIKAPPAQPAGPVRIPPGSNTADAMEYDFIETPRGLVSETGIARFAIRGGADANPTVALRFANNGALNLARLARSAYDLAVAKGVTITGNRIDWKGQTFALSCAMQMGNDKDAEGARAFGYVGEFDLKWIREKVESTIEALATTTTLAAGRGQVDGHHDDSKWMHPYHSNTEYLQTPAWEQGQGKNGPIPQRKKGVAAIASNTFKHQTVKSWGETSAGQKAWVQDPVVLAALAQRRLVGSWAPGADWHGHPTYITQCPDFTPILTACFTASTGPFQKQDHVAAHILVAMKAIGAQLQLAPMNHDIIEDPDHQKRLEVANKAVIAAAFAAVGTSQIQTEIEGLALPREKPSTKGSEKPVAGDSPNGEGLVVLKNWTSRDPK